MEDPPHVKSGPSSHQHHSSRNIGSFLIRLTVHLVYCYMYRFSAEANAKQVPGNEFDDLTALSVDPSEDE